MKCLSDICISSEYAVKALVFRQSVCHLTKETLFCKCKHLGKVLDLYHWNVRHASQWPYVATVQTASFCKSVNAVVQFGVFRAVVAISFFALSILSRSACLTSVLP